MSLLSLPFFGRLALVAPAHIPNKPNIRSPWGDGDAANHARHAKAHRWVDGRCPNPGTEHTACMPRPAFPHPSWTGERHLEGTIAPATFLTRVLADW